MAEPGKVYLVGAGPGDPGLITVKGLALLRRADVVIYDRLAPPELLAEARAGTELIDGGKQPTRHRLSQEAINQVMIDRAQQGALVVRLKGGDPFVFGRGGEEALACAAAGVAYEVVPGVSSAFAVPAYAGIPLTHRQLARSFSVFTGHEDPTTPETALDYAALVQQDTLVVMMGVTQLAKIVARLIEHGKHPDTPAACIEWGTVARQRVVEGTLTALPGLVQQAEIQPPAIMVVGEVVRLRSQGLDWFKP